MILTCISCGSNDMAIMPVNGKDFWRNDLLESGCRRIITIWKCNACTTLHTQSIVTNREGKTMTEKVDSGAPEEAKQQMTRSELLEKLRSLEENKVSIESMKKDATKDYADQITELKKEIKDVLAQLKNTVAKEGTKQ